MRGEVLPADEQPLRDDIGDIEDGAQPVVLKARQVDVLLHARQARVAQIAAVEHGEHVEEEDERDQAVVELADDGRFFLRGGRDEVGGGFFGVHVAEVAVLDV